jgi:hypothetical protein
MKKITIRPDIKLTKRPERDKARELAAASFLWNLVVHAKTQLDFVTWINEGGLDAEEFMECLDTGHWHPLLRRWDTLKGTSSANRPPPTARELYARRLIVLATIVLERVVSLDKQEARERVAKAVAEVFDNPPSAETIRRWQRELKPPINAADERVLATAITHAQGDSTALVIYFRGLAHTVMSPAPITNVED